MGRLTEYYEILGMPPCASEEKITAAHKDLIKIWNPDRFLDDVSLQQKATKKLQEVNAAYQGLQTARPMIEILNNYTETLIRIIRQLSEAIPSYFTVTSSNSDAQEFTIYFVAYASARFISSKHPQIEAFNDDILTFLTAKIINKGSFEEYEKVHMLFSQQYRRFVVDAKLDSVNLHADCKQAGLMAEAESLHEACSDESKPLMESHQDLIGFLMNSACGLYAKIIERTCGVVPRDTPNFPIPALKSLILFIMMLVSVLAHIFEAAKALALSIEETKSL